MRCSRSSLAEAHYVGYVQLLNNNPNLVNPIQKAPGWFPEKLLNDVSIDVEPDNAQPIWVRYTVPKDAAAGTYTGSVTVKTTMGDFEVPVSLTVRDVTLPDPQDGTFNLELWGQLVKCFEDTGNDLDVIGKAYGITAYSDEWWSLMETYAEFMRVNRLNSLFVNVADLLADAPEPLWLPMERSPTTGPCWTALWSCSWKKAVSSKSARNIFALKAPSMASWAIRWRSLPVKAAIPMTLTWNSTRAAKSTWKLTWRS